MGSLPAELEDPRTLGCLRESSAHSQGGGKPGRCLQAERDRDGLLKQRSAEHHGRGVALDECRERVLEPIEVGVE